MSLILKFAPMNAQDTEATPLGTANLNLFANKPMLDRGVREFIEKVTGDSLLIQVDLFQEGLKRHEIRAFVNRAVAGAEAVSDAALKHLKSLRPKR